MLDDVDQHNVDEAVRRLKSEVSAAVPVEW